MFDQNRRGQFLLMRKVYSLASQAFLTRLHTDISKLDLLPKLSEILSSLENLPMAGDHLIFQDYITQHLDHQITSLARTTSQTTTIQWTTYSVCREASANRDQPRYLSVVQLMRQARRQPTSLLLL